MIFGDCSQCFADSRFRFCTFYAILLEMLGVVWYNHNIGTVTHDFTRRKMIGTVYTKTYSSPPIDRKEILRYAGVREDTSEITALLEECLCECDGKLTYNVCYAEFDITRHNGFTDMAFFRTDSKMLSENLAGCASAVLFAATVGIGIDRLIARFGTVSPAKALMLQAIGAERIESLCDAFCKDMAECFDRMGRKLHKRFSPGYGDLPITVQKDIFSVLDCPRRIGLCLNDSMIMSPTKSVTAFMGVSDKNKKSSEV